MHSVDPPERDSIRRRLRDPEPPLTDKQLLSNQWHAQMQADRIMDYWHRKGRHEVRAWVAFMPRDGYAVRSNLVKGLPPPQ